MSNLVLAAARGMARLTAALVSGLLLFGAPGCIPADDALLVGDLARQCRGGSDELLIKVLRMDDARFEPLFASCPDQGGGECRHILSSEVWLKKGERIAANWSNLPASFYQCENDKPVEVAQDTDPQPCNLCSSIETNTVDQVCRSPDGKIYIPAFPPDPLTNPAAARSWVTVERNEEMLEALFPLNACVGKPDSLDPEIDGSFQLFGPGNKEPSESLDELQVRLVEEVLVEGEDVGRDFEPNRQLQRLDCDREVAAGGPLLYWWMVERESDGKWEVNFSDSLRARVVEVMVGDVILAPLQVLAFGSSGVSFADDTGRPLSVCTNMSDGDACGAPPTGAIDFLENCYDGSNKLLGYDLTPAYRLADPTDRILWVAEFRNCCRACEPGDVGEDCCQPGGKPPCPQGEEPPTEDDVVNIRFQMKLNPS